MTRPKPLTFRCPVPDCDLLLKVPADAKSGDYQCKCQHSVLRYHVKEITLFNGRVDTVRTLQQAQES